MGVSPDATPARMRPLRASDLDFAMEVKEAAGWNQTPADWRDFLALRPDGCFLAELDGLPAGTVTTTLHAGSVGWIGMLLVHPRARRRGVGTALLEGAIASLQRAGAHAIRLDATPAGRLVYEPRGFRAEGELERRVRSAGAAAQPAAMLPPGIRLRPMAAEDLERVDALDARAFGVSRRPVLEAWLRRAPRLAHVAEGPDGLAGHVLGRPGSHREHVGPLVATSGEVAAALLARTLDTASEGAVLLDTFTGDASWLVHLTRCGFAVERGFTRMCLGASAPSGETLRQYAIAGPELG